MGMVRKAFKIYEPITAKFLHMVKKNIAVVLIFASTFTCNRQIIQLQKSSGAPEVLKRIDTLDSIAYQYIDVNNKRAKMYSSRALQLSREVGDTV
jgi:hypothetical protein